MATETFQNVLHIVQTSGLNFRMEISAYSATIHLKNFLLKDKNGNPFSLLYQNPNIVNKPDGFFIKKMSFKLSNPILKMLLKILNKQIDRRFTLKPLLKLYKPNF